MPAKKRQQGLLCCASTIIKWRRKGWGWETVLASANARNTRPVRASKAKARKTRQRDAYEETQDLKSLLRKKERSDGDNDAQTRAQTSGAK